MSEMKSFNMLLRDAAMIAGVVSSCPILGFKDVVVETVYEGAEVPGRIRNIDGDCRFI